MAGGLENKDVLSVQEQAVSKWGGRVKSKSCFGRLSSMCPNRKMTRKSSIEGNLRKIGKWAVGWNSNDKILEEQVGDYREMGNLELEEHKVNNAISESRLGNTIQIPPHRNERYSRERTKKIIEQEMSGMRKEIPKGELVTVMGMRKDR